MPKIRITCPTCATPLELDAAYAGQEVQCGSCHQVFVAAEDRRRTRDDDEDRPSRRRRSRRDEDDDDDFDDRPRRRRRRAAADSSPLGTWALVLGILSIPLACCCGLFATPVAAGGLICGIAGLKYPASRGTALAGAICGGLGVALMIANVALGLAVNLGQFGNNFNNRRFGPPPPQQNPPPWGQPPRPQPFQ
jgi:hypothetical protein